MEFLLVALWLGAFLALLLAGLPLADALFGRLADRGVGVALVCSFTVVWLVAYWVGRVSLDAAPFVAVAVLALVAGGLVARRGVELDRRVLAETVGVFTLAFLFLVAVRAVDPAVHPPGGEKFLDFGLLQSLLRAPTLPPEDMWFAGEPVSYYYGGHLLASLLARLTATEARFAYNLALAGFFAAFVTAAYGLAGSVAASRDSPRWLGGVFGAFFVGVASNLTTPLRLIVTLVDGWATYLSGLSGVVGTLLTPLQLAVAALNGVIGALVGTLGVETDGLAAGLGQFDYWDASRVIDGTINEFPLFAWLNGDLHAHMMGPPFLLLAATVLFTYYLTPAAAVWRRRALLFGAAPALAGLLAVVNTWSFPSVAGLTMLAVWFAPAEARTLLPASVADRLDTDDWRRDELLTLSIAAGAGGLVLLGGLLLSVPFWLVAASGRELALFPPRSGLGALVLVHGTFLLVFVPYLLRHALPRLRDGWRTAGMLVLVGVIAVLSRAAAVALFLPLIGVGWALLRWQAPPSDVAAGLGDRLRPGRPNATTVSADGGGDGDTTTDVEGTVGAESTDSGGPSLPGPGFETVLLIAGAGLVLLVEFVYVKEQAGPGRMNTVFKTYAQVWALWAVAAGAALAHLVWQHRPELGLSGGRWRPALQVFAALLLAGTAVYGGLAVTSHFASDSVYAQTEDPTLDATEFVGRVHPEEAAAIRWIGGVDGRPTITTAPGSYTWNGGENGGSSAPSSLTGVPTVLGWHHEIGYRGRAAYDRRAADLRTIYTGDPEASATLLDEYDVRYVYVGPAERATYESSYGSITVGEVAGVTVEKRWDEVTIYEVEQSALPA
jgi:YYY domain-containing protein